MILGDGNLSSQLSTGNKLIDALGGGIYGLANATQDKGWYIPQFQYAGNGLAKNSMQYFANPDYTNMYDANGRITIACESKAKLMISLHVNNGKESLSGLEIYSLYIFTIDLGLF